MYRRYKKMNTEELLIGDVIQRLLGHLQSPPAACAQHTSPGMAGIKSSWITCTEQSCEAFSSSCRFLVGTISPYLIHLGWQNCRNQSLCWVHGGCRSPLTCFPPQNRLLLVNSKTYHTEVPWVEEGGIPAAVGVVVVVSYLPQTIVTVPGCSWAATWPREQLQWGCFESHHCHAYLDIIK